MSAITLGQIMGMDDEHEKIDDLAVEILELIDDGEPLQESVFTKWKRRNKLHGEHIKEAVTLALKSGWILEDSHGIHLTHEGRKRRDE